LKIESANFLNIENEVLMRSLRGKFYIILVCLCCFLTIQAQAGERNDDAGLWVNVSLAPKPFGGKWKTLYSLEYRSKEHFQTTDLWCGMLNTDYILNQYVQIGAGYEIFLNREADGGFTPEYRYYPEGVFSYKWGAFSSALRMRVMNTYTQWRDPNIEARNRFKVNYAIKNTPLKPFVSVEPYHNLRKEFSFTKIRYIAGCGFCFDHQQIDVYYMRECYQQKMFTRNVLEIDYNYSF
jgi:hypothetical protein